MADEDTQTTKSEERGYRESEDFVPNPFDHYGSVSTNGFGGHFSDLRGISPIFAQANKDSLKLAKKALDPKDPTPASHVVLPVGAYITNADPEAAKARVLGLAAAVEGDDDLEEDETSASDVEPTPGGNVTSNPYDYITPEDTAAGNAEPV